MRAVETKIFRPVSLPPQLAGAPMGPGVLNMVFWVMLFMVSSIADFAAPVIFIFAMIGCHLILWSYYTVEPHLTTLMATWYKSTRRVPSIGPHRTPDYHP